MCALLWQVFALHPPSPSALCDIATKLSASKGSHGFTDLQNWMRIKPLLPWLLQSQQSQAPACAVSCKVISWVSQN